MPGLAQFHRRVAVQGAASPVEALLLLILWPFSLIYGLISWSRNKCYDWRLIPSYRASVPVVSVGNLAVGGTGKTPVVDFLVKEFIAQGKRPAVVSRGYGGSFVGSVGIVSQAAGLLLSAAEAGDEPYLLACKNPQALVLIARKRADGVRVAVDELAADIIILDDGFQHRAVQRDLDLVLLDAKRPYGNRWPLPAGLLREFPAALKRADLLMLTRSSEETEFSFAAKPVVKSRHQLSDQAIGLDGQQLSLQSLSQQKLFAFAGIADPAGFFAALNASGLQIGGSLSLSDHCSYDQQFIEEIVAAASRCDALITTEKDAVKLSAGMFELPCYQVPMSIVIENEADFMSELNQRLWSS
ncbi:tetraacyldisaccharide 4'-kinase [Deltaproteobacteria bacterium]|nr:tetraacyldisaccharide 4'-kinase [Deltaproteobacteria bacterium]